MAWSRAIYDKIKREMRPGDVIAFGGIGGFAGVIKWATLGTVNHVAVVVSPGLPADGAPPDERSELQMHPVRIMESTSALDDVEGVNARDLKERIDDHVGEIWWLPLSDEARQRLDHGRFHEFLSKQLGKGYDSVQAFKSAMDDFEDAPLFGRLTHSKEDFTRFFCSELVAAGLEAGGAIGNVNSSEVTPMDLATFSIFQDTYYQLKGDRRLIKGYNRLHPEGFGVLPEQTSVKQRLLRYPVLLGLIISGTLLLGLLIQELLLGQFAVMFGPEGSPRDFRLAVVHCLLAGYLPGACLYLLRGMRTTAAELGVVVNTKSRGAPVVVSAADVGEEEPISKRSLLLAGLIGLLLLGVALPPLTAQPASSAWVPSAWTPEVWWHRILGLLIGWWAAWFVLAIRHTSSQISRLADRIQRLDLLDLGPFAPFVKQGLLTSVLTVGTLSIGGLFLIEPGMEPVVAIMAVVTVPMAILGLLWPMRGLRKRICEIKAAELAWTQQRIRRASAFVYKLSGPESPGLLADLIAYQQLIKAVPEWPIESAAIMRVALYLLIPAGSWFGSLVLENVLGHLFG